MEMTRNSKYWYGDGLTRAQKGYFPNLTKTDLKKETKETLQNMYNNYHELLDNLYWEHEHANEYRHYKLLPKIDKEKERTYKNLQKIEDVYESKR